MSKVKHSFLFVALASAAASSISLLGGLGFEHFSDRILPLVPLLIAVPSLNNLVGDYASVIAAHTGDPKERPRTHQELSQAIARVVGFNILAVVLLSLIMASVRGYAAEIDFVLRFSLFVGLAVSLLVLLMFGLTRVLDRILIRSRLNPDDLLIPITTSIADVCMFGLVVLGATFLL